MEVEIDITKSARENAALYFERAKKLRRKVEGAKAALKEFEKPKKVEKKVAPRRKQEWYEKFRWFLASNGSLVIGGRDATQNEILIKKHLETGDKVFHTELPGSPFVVIKGGSEKALAEAATFVAVYSRAWKAGRGTADVYWVEPDQVSKEAPAGEYIAKGSFMIYGKKNFFKDVVLETTIGFDGEKVIYGPLGSVTKKAKKWFLLKPGEESSSVLAKKILGWFVKDVAVSIEEVQRALPPGGGKIIRSK